MVCYVWIMCMVFPNQLYFPISGAPCTILLCSCLWCFSGGMQIVYFFAGPLSMIPTRSILVDFESSNVNFNADKLFGSISIVFLARSKLIEKSYFDYLPNIFQVILAFYDPCNMVANPGWPLRNLLALASVRWGVTRVQALCYRENRGGHLDLEHSPVLDIILPPKPG